MNENNAKKENESEHHSLFSEREEWCRIKYGSILTKKDIQTNVFKFLKRGIKIKKYWIQSIWQQKKSWNKYSSIIIRCKICRLKENHEQNKTPKMTVSPKQHFVTKPKLSRTRSKIRNKQECIRRRKSRSFHLQALNRNYSRILIHATSLSVT